MDLMLRVKIISEREESLTQKECYFQLLVEREILWEGYQFQEVGLGKFAEKVDFPGVILEILWEGYQFQKVGLSEFAEKVGFPGVIVVMFGRGCALGLQQRG